MCRYFSLIFSCDAAVSSCAAIRYLLQFTHFALSVFLMIPQYMSHSECSSGASGVGGVAGGAQNAKVALLPALKHAGLVSGSSDPKLTQMDTSELASLLSGVDQTLTGGDALNGEHI